ncbi:MAG: succinate dehydrogenase, cytochrome b556 subunit [Gammaproteobacteria bacterium]|nr:succinate dehydrogenase, cytochrome b556 subunit [Gammaproteobacteria bacterium]MYI77637.1 succinate dehydrogenase, cytochrome b556 subunit [Gammaproteobacteria bacterium]
MKSTRPVFLNLFAIRFPIVAVVSILHRVSGVALFGASFYLLWILWLSLESETSFTSLKTTLEHPLHSLVLWFTLSLLGYHIFAGLRHLLMDLHIGDSLKAGRASAAIVLFCSVVLSLAIGVWFWL